MKDKNVDQAIPILLAWFITFSAGIIIAGEKNLAVGLTIAIASVILLVIKLSDDYKAEQKQKRIDKNVERHKRAVEEVMRKR
jgi:predicted ABC-type sugar transport system permease subunit